MGFLGLQVLWRGDSLLWSLRQILCHFLHLILLRVLQLTDNSITIALLPWPAAPLPAVGSLWEILWGPQPEALLCGLLRMEMGMGGEL